MSNQHTLTSLQAIETIERELFLFEVAIIAKLHINKPPKQIETSNRNKIMSKVITMFMEMNKDDDFVISYLTQKLIRLN